MQLQPDPVAEVPALPRASAETARLVLGADRGRGRYDGGWWPRSGDVAAELDLLLTALGPLADRVRRVSLSIAGWPDHDVLHLEHGGHLVKLGWFAHLEDHTVSLGDSSSRTHLVLLVVPVDTPAEVATRALEQAAGSTRTADELLMEGTGAAR